jgi:hypothetical protein
MTLPEKIAAGLARSEDIAFALGWKWHEADNDREDDYRWIRPDGDVVNGLPPWQTCLTTLLKECERRNVRWIKDHRAGGLMIIARRTGSFTDHWFTTDDTAKGDTLALCAALVAAVMETNDDCG